MGKVMRHTLGASLNIRHNLSSSKGPKPLQLKLLTTYIPKTSRSEERFSRNAETDLVCRLLLEKKKKKAPTRPDRPHGRRRGTRHSRALRTPAAPPHARRSRPAPTR